MSTNTASEAQSRKDIYTRVIERIIADLEQGVRTWLKPWSAEHAAGKISSPLNGGSAPTLGIRICRRRRRRSGLSRGEISSPIAAVHRRPIRVSFDRSPAWAKLPPLVDCAI
jgi:hypothetical protein